MPATIAVVCSDLMLQSRVVEHARRSGFETALADSDAGLRAALDAGAALVVLDLHIDGLDWRAAASDAGERDVPVLAFGRHTEAALLREAREAGIERVVARSTLVEDLPQLLSELVRARA